MQAIITCAKSWHTPWRELRTSSTGVETVVARWSYLKSVKMRWHRSSAASSSGRPASKRRCGIGGERRAKRDTRRFKDELERVEGVTIVHAGRLRARPVPTAASAPDASFRARRDRPRCGGDDERLVRFIDREMSDLVAEVVMRAIEESGSGTTTRRCSSGV